MSVERIYSVEEAADILRMKPEAVLRLTRGPAPKLGYLPAGRKRTFPESAIEAYVEAHKVTAAPANPFGLTDGAMRRVRRSA